MFLSLMIDGKECYSINKTSIRKNYSGVTEIVELKSK